MSSVEGLDELLNNLALLGGNVKESCVKGLERGAKKIQKNAKYLAPVGKKKKKSDKTTGHLRNSIKTKAEGRHDGAIAQVYTNLEYAKFVEFRYRTAW